MMTISSVTTTMVIIIIITTTAMKCQYMHAFLPSRLELSTPQHRRQVYDSSITGTSDSTTLFQHPTPPPVVSQSHHHPHENTDASPWCTTRRHTLRQWIEVPTIFLGVLPIAPTATNAASSSSSSQTKEELQGLIHDAFRTIQQEFEKDSNGGIYTLQQYIQNEDYPAIMEFTKTYDQILRKGMMNKAKKLLLQYVVVEATANEKNDPQEVEDIIERQKKYINERATTLGNAITFDLIGLNRNARPGQISNPNCQKYIQDLRQDLQQFILLEQKFV